MCSVYRTSFPTAHLRAFEAASLPVERPIDFMARVVLL